jgi:lipoprotein-anchoring transpeptidase ErfK/SrfK
VPDPQYTRYGRRRRRRWPYLVAGVVAAALALVAWQLVGVPRVSATTPGQDAFVKDASVTVMLTVRGLEHLDDVRVEFDGQDVTSRTTRQGNTLTFATDGLDDGLHRASFSATSSNLFRHDVRKDWRFTVDTSLPSLKLDASAEEGRINTSPARFTGSTEAYSRVVVTSGAVSASGTADETGAYDIEAPLPEGRSQVTVATTDRAGNTTSKDLSVYVDAVPPTLTVKQLDDVLHHAGVKVRISGQDQLGPPKLKATLDGKRVKLSGTASRATLKVKGLAQGRHELVVSAADKGGNVVSDEQTFVVDSSERFGSAIMWPGARGKDVRQLQARLADLGIWTGYKTSTYGERTIAAVERFQKRYGLEVDGIVGGMTLNALSGQIIVDLGDLRLYLYRDTKLVKSYPVATGQSEYPTPTGSFSVTVKTMNPTWYPPDSEWAKDAKPIPPGIENPLGTRWIGTSAPAVGIHGTPDDASIGSYASHGCIRMHIWDVEDLFDRVVIGMPVIIRQ